MRKAWNALLKESRGSRGGPKALFNTTTWESLSSACRESELQEVSWGEELMRNQGGSKTLGSPSDGKGKGDKERKETNPEQKEKPKLIHRSGIALTRSRKKGGWMGSDLSIKSEGVIFESKGAKTPGASLLPGSVVNFEAYEGKTTVFNPKAPPNLDQALKLDIDERDLVQGKLNYDGNKGSCVVYGMGKTSTSGTLKSGETLPPSHRRTFSSQPNRKNPNRRSPTSRSFRVWMLGECRTTSFPPSISPHLSWRRK